MKKKSKTKDAGYTEFELRGGKWLILDHLEDVSKEIDRLMVEVQEKYLGAGDIENRLHFAVRAVNPYRAVCSKHNQKIKKNIWGEFSCAGCIEDFIYDRIPIDETIWFDPDNKPLMKIDGIKYGFNPKVEV